MISREIILENNSYTSPDISVAWWKKKWPNLAYIGIARVVFHASHMAKSDRFDDNQFVEESLATARVFESFGTRFEIQGLEHIKAMTGPCVFVSNHMSTMETFVLPSLVVTHRPATFVVKESLINYPVFGAVMRARDPVVVGRKNPRQDLQITLEKGMEKLKQGISVIIFPQTTRTVEFDPKKFNSIGTKLALRSNVPIIPIALKTNAWGNGKKLKEFGPIDPSKPVRIVFGEPITLTDRGHRQHQMVVEFIQQHLENWKTQSKPENVI
jgi:1-acyl-sn-glycerol-3-phosphate acyltransferase